MKKLALLILPVLLPWMLCAQERYYIAGEYEIEGIRIEDKRPLEDIGTQKTILDSLALRESVTNSLADVLSRHSNIFIKSYGRGTLATASFRGTAASHTQVTWNGMKINSPMLGMVDFSLIPSYFIDDATLYHGATSVGVTGGGLGGAIALGTEQLRDDGLGLRFVQGIGSFDTYDEFLRVSYGSKKWRASTRIYYTRSDNDFKYKNYKRKVHIKDEQGTIVDSYYPVSRNKNGSFEDFHALQEVYYNTDRGDRFGLTVWYMDSQRGLPMISSDMKDSKLSKEIQDERTLRTSLDWTRYRANFTLKSSAGYTHSEFRYIKDSDVDHAAVRAQYSMNNLNTVFGRVGAEYKIGRRWIFTGNVSVHQHWVDNSDRRKIPGKSIYERLEKSRTELSAFVSARYKPTERLGFALNLREEWCSDGSPQFIPVVFAEYSLTGDGSLILKSSAARNYRFPTLNDLYFKPGGNRNLKPEHGYTYDAGLEYSMKDKTWDIGAEAAFFDSYIEDWILWELKRIPTPVNIKEVRSYGVEMKGRLGVDLGREWSVLMQGIYTWSRSENRREPFTENDMSIGKQLPYIPKYSSSLTGRLRWKRWEFTYGWQYYSERFTTSDNDRTGTLTRLTPFYMNDISLERSFDTSWARLSFRCAVNNLFDEEYEEVLSRPMAGRNYGLYIEITPKFGKKRK